MVAAEGACARQARLTFAMARHAVVDLAQVFRTRPRPAPEDRLPAPVLAKLTADLAAAGFPLLAEAVATGRLRELRRTYEPYAAALSDYLLQEIRKSAQRPTMEELLERLKRRTPVEVSESPAEILRAARENRGRR